MANRPPSKDPTNHAEGRYDVTSTDDSFLGETETTEDDPDLRDTSTTDDTSMTGGPLFGVVRRRLPGQPVLEVC